MARNADDELVEAFERLKLKRNQINDSMQILDANTEMMNKMKEKLFFTDKALKALPENVNTYTPVGRMYVLTPQADVHRKLRSVARMYDETLEDIKNKKQFLDRHYKQEADKIRELIALQRRGDEDDSEIQEARQEAELKATGTETYLEAAKAQPEI